MQPVVAMKSKQNKHQHSYHLSEASDFVKNETIISDKPIELSVENHTRPVEGILKSPNRKQELNVMMFSIDNDSQVKDVIIDKTIESHSLKSLDIVTNIASIDLFKPVPKKKEKVEQSTVKINLSREETDEIDKIKKTITDKIKQKNSLTLT